MAMESPTLSTIRSSVDSVQLEWRVTTSLGAAGAAAVISSLVVGSLWACLCLIPLRGCHQGVGLGAQLHGIAALDVRPSLQVQCEPFAGHVYVGRSSLFTIGTVFASTAIWPVVRELAVFPTSPFQFQAES